MTVGASTDSPRERRKRFELKGVEPSTNSPTAHHQETPSRRTTKEHHQRHQPTIHNPGTTTATTSRTWIRKRYHQRRPTISKTKGTQTEMTFGTGQLRFKQTIRVIQEVRCQQPLNFGSNGETPSRNEPQQTENEMDNGPVDQLCSAMLDLSHTPNSHNWDMETAWFEKND